MIAFLQLPVFTSDKHGTRETKKERKSSFRSASTAEASEWARRLRAVRFGDGARDSVTFRPPIQVSENAD